MKRRAVREFRFSLVMVINRQNRVQVDLRSGRAFVGRLRRALDLGKRDFNVCFVDDREIARLNAAYRGKNRPTDVLSFGWNDGAERRNWKLETRISSFEFRGFLGDIVISVETARENARAEGHSTAAEIRWLILHGLLHLLGYDHETDQGEMKALELELRDRLEKKVKGQRSKVEGKDENAGVRDLRAGRRYASAVWLFIFHF